MGSRLTAIALAYTWSMWVFPWESPQRILHIIKCHSALITTSCLLLITSFQLSLTHSSSLSNFWKPWMRTQMFKSVLARSGQGKGRWGIVAQGSTHHLQWGPRDSARHSETSHASNYWRWIVLIYCFLHPEDTWAGFVSGQVQLSYSATRGTKIWSESHKE